jgi:hypothetical protein
LVQARDFANHRDYLRVDVAFVQVAQSIENRSNSDARAPDPSGLRVDEWFDA